MNKNRATPAPLELVRDLFTLVIALLIGPIQQAIAENIPAADLRAANPKDLNTQRIFPEINSKSEWETRAKEIREQILVSCGLWPMPQKTPLQEKIFGKVVRNDYSVEKVYFQTYPGFYLGGNLYRPVGKGNGPFPAILNPHGHWNNGRMADTQDGSIAARCISFARQGMIAFSYDMVGYNDTIQINHRFANNPSNQLWNISLMGLQTWNSIRALDFLESLPDVDKGRLACTGESGGGTQTFMLGAIDSRLKVQAPIVMVSHSMQGGCLCENAPGLRVDYSNMEIAAAPAPRPQILVAATGDWTKDTLSVEGPAIGHIYQLFDSNDKLRYVRFDFGHNYNQTSREAVYQWFGKWLLNHPDPSSLKEAPYEKEPDQDLRVWPNSNLPNDALKEEQLGAYLVELYQAYLEALQPADDVSLRMYKRIMLPAWRHTLQVEFPENGLLVQAGPEKNLVSCVASEILLGRVGKGDRIPAILFNPNRNTFKTIVVLAHPDGKSGFLEKSGAPKGLAKKILDRGHSVLVVDTFLTGDLANPEIATSRKPFTNYFSTYNRTDLQQRVQDLITACAFAQTHSKSRRVILCGTGRAGLWSLLAAPAANAVVADCDKLDLSTDGALLTPDLFVPGIRKIGAFEGVAMLAAPNPILIHNAGSKFPSGTLRDTYEAVNALKSFHSEPNRLEDDAISKWISNL